MTFRAALQLGSNELKTYLDWDSLHTVVLNKIVLVVVCNKVVVSVLVDVTDVVEAPELCYSKIFGLYLFFKNRYLINFKTEYKIK